MTLRQLLQCELARRDFWEYCKLIAPDFYKEDRPFLRDKCKQYQEFWNGPEQYLIDNEPPRHGKSRTAQLFVQWLIGSFPGVKIVTGSYNETLSTTFSKSVRNRIAEKKADNHLVYSDIFPDITIRKGDGAANLWGIEGQETYSYLATSPTGTVTGFGADLVLIDDVIKNAYEARNENIKEQHWRWYNDTMFSRLEGRRKILIVMTRWATDDLAGRLLAMLDKRGAKYRHIIYRAWDGVKMLCPEILNYAEYQEILTGDTGRDIIEANYNQAPIDLTGRLYTSFKTYAKLPEKIESIDSYTDTADQGADYLCSITYAVSAGLAYVLDIIYTQAPMEVTEKQCAEAFTRLNVNHARIESNNGGRGWGRNVQRIAREMGNRHTTFQSFTQSKNKESRILVGSTGVMNCVIFPEFWKEKWPEYARDMERYQRAGKNAHDDAQDCTTGVYEYLPKRRG